MTRDVRSRTVAPTPNLVWEISAIELTEADAEVRNRASSPKPTSGQPAARRLGLSYARVMWIGSYALYGAPKRVSSFAPPPPVGPVTPVHKKILVGSVLHRVYDPKRFGATATGYRYDGPFVRMDQHLTSGGDRGILYAASSYAGSLIEVIDGPLLHIGSRRHVTLRVEADLCMLDLRGNGALGAGTDARIGKCPHDEAQPWARYFYEQATYGAVAGLLWFNSHNDDEAIALFERAGSIFSVLTDVPLSSELVDIASLIMPMRKTIDFSSI